MPLRIDPNMIQNLEFKSLTEQEYSDLVDALGKSEKVRSTVATFILAAVNTPVHQILLCAIGFGVLLGAELAEQQEFLKKIGRTVQKGGYIN